MKKKGGFGGFPGMGGLNMGALMKQAHEMQENIKKVQEELEQETAECSAGGGAVKVVVTGNKEIKELIIKPEVVNPEEVEMLQDLLMAAINEAVRKIDKISSSKMGAAAGDFTEFLK